MAREQELDQFVRDSLVDTLGVAADLLFGKDLTLAEILAASERLTNSVDLMEACAKTANALRKRFGVRIRLQAFTSDTKISVLAASMVSQALALEAAV